MGVSIREEETSIPLPVERHPNANRLKASEIEQNIGVNIEFNIDPDVLFDLRELLIRFSYVPFNRKGYIPKELLKLFGYKLCERKGAVSKRSFFLLEVVIALGLLSVLLSFLFSYLAQSAKLEQKIASARQEILARQNVQVRVSDLLVSLVPMGQKQVLYTEQFPKEEKPSLVVVFDQGVDPDPAFSGAVVGRLYLDADHQLCLAIWPLQGLQNGVGKRLQSERGDLQRPWRNEVLMSHVTDLSFSFLGKSLAPKLSSIDWLSLWPKESEQPPSMIRMTIQREQERISFAFLLPISSLLPTYWEGGSPS